MDKGTKVEMQDSFAAWMELYDEMDALQERRRPTRRRLGGVFAEAQSKVGTNSEKNRGHSRQGVVVITTRQHERGNIWNIIVVVS